MRSVVQAEHTKYKVKAEHQYAQLKEQTEDIQRQLSEQAAELSQCQGLVSTGQSSLNSDNVTAALQRMLQI